MAIRKYHIGLTQWGYKEWKGGFFRDDTRQEDFLRQYASVFNTVEGNTTFYRVPEQETVIRWGEQVPDGFNFCFKFPQSVTHYKRLKDVKEEVNSFLDLFWPIRTKLGPFHIQLSSQFSYNELHKIEELFDMLPGQFSYALEVRHPDFFDQGKKEKDFERLLKSYSVSRVVFDTRRLHSLQNREASVLEAQERKPKTPVRFHSTSAFPFIRFVGANDILNNEAYLKEWAIITANWIKDGKHPYIFIHAPDTGFAPEIARYFHSELSRLTEINPLPPFPASREDRQLGLF